MAATSKPRLVRDGSSPLNRHNRCPMCFHGQNHERAKRKHPNSSTSNEDPCAGELSGRGKNSDGFAQTSSAKSGRPGIGMSKPKRISNVFGTFSPITERSRVPAQQKTAERRGDTSNNWWGQVESTFRFDLSISLHTCPANESVAGGARQHQSRRSGRSWRAGR